MASADDPGRYRRFALFAGIVWILLSLLSAPGFYLQRALTGEAAHADAALVAAFVAGLGWAFATFLLLVFGTMLERHRLRGTVWWLWHLAFAASLVLVAVVLMRWWNWPILGLADTLRAPDLVSMLAAAWPRGLIIYAALWCLCQAALLRRSNVRLEARLVSTELHRLRAQLNPHFLFNTLNAISELGYSDPEAADRTITQLSGLLRKSLDESSQQEIALRDELDFLRRYLDIQQTLLRGRLQIEFDIAGNTLNARVPGMILQPLAENAVTHGIGRNGTGSLMVRSRRENETLVLEVEDSGWGLRSAAGSRNGRGGIGIGNTRTRLSYLYGELAGLELLNRPGEGLLARLNIPFHEAYAFDENPYPDR